MKELFHFVYKVELDHDLTEHEYDHVFFGTFAGTPNPASEEAADWQWIGIEQANNVVNQPDLYTYWLKVSFPKVVQVMNSLEIKY